MNLKNYDIVIINTSAGKDSLCSIHEMCRLAKEQNYPLSKIHLSHQDLGESEWKGTKELAIQQAEFFGLEIHISAYKNRHGENKSLLDYIEKRGMFPSNKQRFCTSEFKRGPGSTVITKLTKGFDNCRVLYVFGFRREESPSRNKKKKLCINKRHSTKTRTVYDYLPIHDLHVGEVWDIIKSNKLPYHYAYDLGMPRLSCCFCIFSPFDALVIAGKANPELLDRYVAVEQKINHTFRKDLAIREIKSAIENNYLPVEVNDWIM